VSEWKMISSLTCVEERLNDLTPAGFILHVNLKNINNINITVRLYTHDSLL